MEVIPVAELQRLRAGIVSAGRVGAVLGAALARGGHPVSAVRAASPNSRRRADQLLPGVARADSDGVARRCDLLLLAVPDDVLAEVVGDLAGNGSLRTGQIVLHTSGVHGVGVLEPAAASGALPVALHPAMTFTGGAEDLERLASCAFGVTAADDATARIGEDLVRQLGSEPVRIPEAARPLYHAALAHGANHLLALVSDCVNLLRGAGIDSAERLIEPLLRASLSNALQHGAAALTGPVARGDVRTIGRHLDVLGRQAPELLPTYRALAGRAAHLAAGAGLLPHEALPAVEERLR
ncbi:Rossmann-like and DUF2520 domain-containing protein [Streptomyces sp. 7N604]|uniref:Rossmann-like and DUF2520 domain-containing protein n=1 Tax=Streptomyces sp. 7N604 TaxID=3457415 RepID=UPI003FD05EA9